MKPLSRCPLSRTMLPRFTLTRLTLLCVAVAGPPLVHWPLAGLQPTAVLAEDAPLDPVEKAEQDAAEFKKRVEDRVVQEFRIAAQSRLLLEIEELSRVCELDAKSVKKLEIAAKGAADRWIRNEEQELRRHVRLERYGEDAEIRVAGKKVPRPGEPEEAAEPQGGENAAGGKNAEQKPGEKPPVLQAINRLFGAAPKPNPRVAEEKENVANISVAVQRYGLQYRVKHRNGSSSSGFGGGLEELKRENVWTQTMQAVVTPQQKQKYEAAIEARRQRLRNSAIIFAIGQIDLELRLAEPQHEQLRDVFETQVDIGNVNPGSVRYTVERQIKETDPALLKPILSAAQLKVWEEFAAW